VFELTTSSSSGDHIQQQTRDAFHVGMATAQHHLVAIEFVLATDAGDLAKNLKRPGRTGELRRLAQLDLPE
jgi:histidine ammonia-lyase